MVQVDISSSVWVVEKTYQTGDVKPIGRVFLTREEARSDAQIRRMKKPYNKYTVRKYVLTNVRA